jgi:DNA-binding transcriptional regulator of glucitol operon
MGLIRRGRFVPWLVELLVIMIGAMFALAWLRAALPWAFAP